MVDTEIIEKFIDIYGDGLDGSSPTVDQWQHIFARDREQPITLVNFFKFREQSTYAGDQDYSCTGEEAFARYAAVSMPSLEKAGGKFLMVAPIEAMFAGSEEEWDLIAIGSYPKTASLIALFEDSDYQQAFFHRTAACEKQKVFIATN